MAALALVICGLIVGASLWIGAANEDEGAPRLTPVKPPPDLALASTARSHASQRSGSPKPVPTVTVVCIGDSITFGNGSHSTAHIKERRGQGEGNYPMELSALLHDAMGSEMAVKVHNFGRSGRTAMPGGEMSFANAPQFTEAKSLIRRWAVEGGGGADGGIGNRLPRKANDRDRLVIVVMLGTNDSKDNKWKGTDAFKNALIELIQALLMEALRGQPTTRTITPPWEKSSLRRIDLLLVTPPPAVNRPVQAKASKGKLSRKEWVYAPILGKINSTRIAVEVREGVFEVAALAQAVLMPKRGGDLLPADRSPFQLLIATQITQRFNLVVQVADIFTEFVRHIVNAGISPGSVPVYRVGANVAIFPSVFSGNRDAILPWGLRGSQADGQYTHVVDLGSSSQDNHQAFSSRDVATFTAMKANADASLLLGIPSRKENRLSSAALPPSYPIEALWYSYPGDTEKLLHDGIHPRRAGHNIIASFVAKKIIAVQ